MGGLRDDFGREWDWVERGRRQGLALAKAWLRDPAVLVLGMFSFFFRWLVI